LAITPSKTIKPDQGINYNGRLKCTVEGSNAVNAGELVIVSGAVFGGRSDAVARKLKVTRITAVTQEGMILVALTGGAVGADVECVQWAVQKLDTSGGALYDEVYMTVAGIATLTGTRGTDTPIGYVAKVATVANGGIVVLGAAARIAIDYLA
jgi:hypothetical protein